MNKKLYDLTGQKFTRLTVIGFHQTNKHAQKTWICQCDCGTQKIIITGALTSGHAKSCGCLSREMSVLRWLRRDA